MLIKNKIAEIPQTKIKQQMTIMLEHFPEMTLSQYTNLCATFFLCDVFGEKHWTKMDNWNNKVTYSRGGPSEGWLKWADHSKDLLRSLPRTTALDIINLKT
jgi:hypothetical protein